MDGHLPVFVLERCRREWLNLKGTWFSGQSADEDNAGQDNAGQDNAGQDNAGQDNADEDNADEDNPARGRRPRATNRFAG